ncbi:MAG TPA: metallophosphoesterase [Myxococcaceae bacterium]
MAHPKLDKYPPDLMPAEKTLKLLRAYAARHRGWSGDGKAKMTAGALPAGGDNDLPHLDPATLDYLLAEAVASPPDAEVAAPISDASVGRTEYLGALESLRAQFEADPQSLEEFLLAQVKFEKAALRLPPEGKWFPAYDEGLTPTPASYRVDSHLFETFGDLWGWIVNCGQIKLPPVAAANRALATQNFVWHTKVQSGYEYPLVNPDPAKPLKVALFADFGTGLIHSRYIARQLASAALPYAFHLGDIYYAGRKAEFEERWMEPLAPVLERTQLFNLAGNHEQYSGNQWYWADIARRRQFHQQQEGSYFRLSNAEFQIIGLDTNSFELERYANPILQKWLVDALREGRASGKTNILLSSEPGHDYFASPPQRGKGRIYKDLAAAAGNIFPEELIDLWFWCHVHYATFNAAAPEEGYPFLSSCIGHGGYPYGTKSGPTTAFMRWVETTPRFPRRTQVRQDMGNNGWCEMALAPDHVKLTYRDWMGFRRCEVAIARQGNGRLALDLVREFPEETT